MRDALFGGALIGLAAAGLLVLIGKTAGVSGMVDGVLRRERGEYGWKAAFLAGLVAGGLLLAWRDPSALAVRSAARVAVGRRGRSARRLRRAPRRRLHERPRRVRDRTRVAARPRRTALFIAAGAMTVLLLRRLG
jgi:hypothetical protein